MSAVLDGGKPRIRGPLAVIERPGVAAEAFHGASSSHPDLRNWWPSQGSADSDILPELGTLVRRSRDLLRNNGVASGAQQTIVDNVLGCGLWLAPTPDYVALKKDRKWASEWRKPVKAKWRLYAETFACDAAESLTGDGLATQFFNGGFANGEGLALPLWMPKPGYKAGTRIQIIEADRLSNPNGRPDSQRLRGGIELNEYGAPQAYYIRNAHPGDRFYFENYELAKWTRIQARTDWGRKLVIHGHDKARAGQTRGVPAVASVLQQFKVMGDFQRAELRNAVVNSMIAIILKSAIGQEGLVELLSSDSQALAKYQEGLANRGRSAIDMGAGGKILTLPLGEDATSFAPARPTTAYDPFVTNVMRHVGVGLNIPYELLMKDFSKTNYSSARASLLEAWRFFIGRRNWLALMFYQPLYELWLEEMIGAGEIEAPDFYENRDAYCRARWIGPGRGWVDPLKEADAAEKRMDIFVSTLEDECAEQGKDWEEVLEQRAEEEARLKELGLERVKKPAQVRDPNAGNPDNPDNPDNAGNQDEPPGAGGSKTSSFNFFHGRPPMEWEFRTDAEGTTRARPVDQEVAA
jgi:lambda family phage portal protein